ncbi:MAG: hypothetical protein ABH919_04305 [bacterium]
MIEVIEMVKNKGNDNKKLVLVFVAGLLIAAIAMVTVTATGSGAGIIPTDDCDICGTWKAAKYDYIGLVATLTPDQKVDWRVSDGKQVFHQSGEWKKQGENKVLMTFKLNGKETELRFEIRGYDLYGPMGLEYQGYWEKRG